MSVDRGYINYEQFRSWNDKGVLFVTRMKSNASYDVVESREVPQKRNIVSDEIVVLTGETTSEKFPGPLRRIVVHDKEKDEDIVLLTNHLNFGSTTISSIYKERWEIELFFKTLKQNLKVKTFIGTSENALRIQIWTAGSIFEVRKKQGPGFNFVQNRDSDPCKHRKQFLDASYFGQQ